MNFHNIRLTPIGKQLVVHTTKTGKIEKINFTMEAKTPFGIETYEENKYINWEIDNEMISLLELVEQNFTNELKKNYGNYNSWSLKTAIRGKEGYEKLLRTKVVGDLVVEPNTTYDVTIILESIWLHKKNKTFGILWHSTSAVTSSS